MARNLYLKPRRHGLSWAMKEIEKLMEEHKKFLTVSEMAFIHERTEFAVECALKKLRLYPRYDSSFIINGINYGRIFEDLTQIIALKIEIVASMKS